MRRSAIIFFACLALHCGKSDSPANSASDDAGTSMSDVNASTTDAGGGDDTSPTPDADGPDASDDAGESDEDAADMSPPLPELQTQVPAETPDDVLEASGVDSCEVYLAETCDAGTLRRCEVYDPANSAFVDEPPPFLRRVLLFDRWYDLYHQPMGQTAERIYSQPVPAGTPESEWASDEAFARYTGLGDAAIWNGAALLSAAMRFLQTGTDADYARMERKTRDLLLQFDVTGIPGYLARYHFLLVDPEAPQRQDVVLRSDAAALDHTQRVIEDPDSVPDLPAVYTEGFVDDEGTRWTGTPMFDGNPSIDQYSGPRTAFGVVHGLLRDESLKTRIEDHLVCYLNRLQRIEIQNLQQNEDAIGAISEFFGAGSGGLNLDAGDPDLTETDTVVLYVTRQPNTKNEDDFDRSCPDGPQLEPVEVIDAAADSFELDVLKLATDLNGEAMEKSSGIDHFYVPSVRGADAVHLMHLATLAYHFTGEEQYRRFLFEELIGNLNAVGVANTAGAFVPPRFCRKFYGHHISFTPAWAFLTLLPDQPLRDEIEQVFRTEFWEKEMKPQWNAKFEIFYVGEVADDAQARSEAVAALKDLGGNGGIFDDPRRAYTIDPNELASNLPDGNEILCPTVAEVEMCEQDIMFAGASIPGPDITFPCTGERPECPIGDECVHAQARDALPPSLRRYEDFMWQRNPYKLGAEPPFEGWRQSPGLDLTEEFWLARHYGLVDDGAGQALGWRDVGACP